MKFVNGRLLNVLPYLGMAAALGLSAWTFIQSDRYRQETDAILNQTFEFSGARHRFVSALYGSTAIFALPTRRVSLMPTSTGKWHW